MKLNVVVNLKKNFLNKKIGSLSFTALNQCLHFLLQQYFNNIIALKNVYRFRMLKSYDL